MKSVLLAHLVVASVGLQRTTTGSPPAAFPVHDSQLTQFDVGSDKMIESPNGYMKPREPGHATWFIMHIPKTGGVTLSTDATEMVGDTDIGVFSTEACRDEFLTNTGWPQNYDCDFGAHKEDVVLTLFRHPREHVVSQYYECSSDHWGRKMVFTEPLGCGGRPEDCIANFSAWINHFSGEFTSDDLGCYHPNDLQVRAMLCKEEMHHQIAETLGVGAAIDEALRRMRTLYFVGLTEYYQESMCLLHAKAFPNTTLPGYCNCEDPEAWASFKPSIDTHGNTHQLTVEDLSTSDLEKVDALTQADLQLYKAATDRFVLEVRQAEKQHGVSILC
jgi:hypothetical protein